MNLQNLLFQVSLLDKVSGPAKGIMSTMDSVTTRIQGGLSKIGYGAAGIAGAFFSLERIVDASDQVDRALAEVSSLGVAQKVLDDLNKTALKFSVQYGEDAAAFVKSSYDIQSAIAGLTGNELPAFTQASGILAKATKADIGTVTSYVGTMYGIFQQNAEAMGKANWVNQLAGQTAAAVQLFKTTGAEMSAAFTSIGAAGQTNGIAMSEQIAILGTLQATMSGSEAGTKYRAFLDGVGKAQEKLGLQFTDSQGRMLPMIKILEKIKGKFGAIDTVAESDLLKKAFGTQEAVALVKLLSTNIDGLSSNIAQVGQQTGIQKAIDMANAMVDPGDRAARSFEALRIILAQKIAPTMDMIYDKGTETATLLMRWTELFPNLTNAVAMGTVSIIGLIGGLSALSVVVGISKFLMVGWSIAAGAVKGVLFALRFAVMQAIPAIWGFTTALLANPITWIVAGIGVLVGLVAAAVIYWDDWTQAVIGWGTEFMAWLSGFDPFYFIGQSIGLVIVAFESIPQWWTGFKEWIGSLDPFALIGAGINFIIAGFEMIPQWWTGFKAWIASLNPFALAADGILLILSGLETIKGWWIGFKSWLASLNPFSGISGAFDSLMRGIQSVTGARIPAINVGATASPAIAAAPKPIAAPAAISQSQTASTPRGGLMSQITNANNSKSVSIGGITVNNYGNKPVNGQRLADELAMVAG